MLRTERPALSAIGFLPIHSNPDTLAISHTLEIVILIVHCHAFGGKKEASVDTVIRARVKPEACTWIGAERRAGHNGPMAPERISAPPRAADPLTAAFVLLKLEAIIDCQDGNEVRVRYTAAVIKY